MSVQNKNVQRKSVTAITAQKGVAAIVCLTAYTAPLARVADEHADLILVGDSLGMVLYGMESTIPVTLEMMIAHGTAVVRASEKALIVVDMPFGTYQESPEQAFRNAAHILKETGVAAVKIEGGEEMAPTCAFLTGRGIPVLGHIGLKPQSVHVAGGYKLTGKSESERLQIMNDALALERAGAFGIVLECVAAPLAAAITAKLKIPTIGIGAGASCDGQILVTEDIVGLSGGAVPKFVKQYANFGDDLSRALQCYATDVRAGRFPEKKDSGDSAVVSIEHSAVRVN